MRRVLRWISLAALVASPTPALAAGGGGFRAEVLAVLERHPSTIAKNTLAAVRDGHLVLDTLDRLTVEDCRQLVEENPGQWKGVVGADECVEGDGGRARVPARILARVSGFQHENRIYVRMDGNARDAAATLVHEANHVANDTHEHYATSREKLVEEYRAYWVSIVFTDGRAPGAGYLAWLKGWIIEQYALTGVSAADVPDRPEGNLDNAFPAPAIVASIE